MADLCMQRVPHLKTYTPQLTSRSSRQRSVSLCGVKATATNAKQYQEYAPKQI